MLKVWWVQFFSNDWIKFSARVAFPADQGGYLSFGLGTHTFKGHNEQKESNRDVTFAYGYAINV